MTNAAKEALEYQKAAARFAEYSRDAGKPSVRSYWQDASAAMSATARFFMGLEV